ncbi:MAG: energy transducer TonB [Melioribacter sp.]|nr:energy transducer TonB [Melioribacter sp.]
MKRLILFVLFVLIIVSCSSKIDKTTKGFTPPSVLKQPRFLYPKVAQEKALEGSTKLLLSINKEGIVEEILIVKSSGYDVLDSAAMEYCRNILFSPAKRDGKPVNSRMEWVVKFNITEQNWVVDNYLLEISNLYRQVDLVDVGEKLVLQREILKKHNEFVQNFRDALNFNKVLSQVISPEISKQWQKDWDGWPLSFLLYYDFIKRFPDYDSIHVVKNLLINSLKSDIQYIKSTQAIEPKIKHEKEKILNKIKIFISNNYPDIILKEIDFEANINSFYLSKSN